MKTTIYANYGLLAAEKRCVYSTTKLDAIVSEPIDVIIPDEYIAGRNEAGEILMVIDGLNYTLQQLLIEDDEDEPCIIIPAPYSTKPIRLERAAI